MSTDLPFEPPGPSEGAAHLRTVSHAGRFWDVYLELTDDPRHPETCRARLCFSAADHDQGEAPRRTTTIFVESSYEDAWERAQALEDHQMVALLRSCLPG